MAKVLEVTAADFLPARMTLPALREAAADCKGCDLYKRATQTVFGEGAAHAAVMFVGEVPGDYEDRVGRPFVGPAGKLLDKALVEAGIPRDEVYVTNAVKHFKWEPRGKRRLHSKPSAREMYACRPWLDAEIAVVRPQIIVCLGASAAQALLGKDFRVTKERGRMLKTAWAQWLTATVHPSSLLRIPEGQDREEPYRLFVADLKKVARQLRTLARTPVQV
ncbi:MAG TPA: UdgX family uracil-DNA binding protein [Phycisphaerae bacterium]|jgi:DNA polymerase